MTTKTTSRLASGTETAESPFQWVLASDLREGDALASGLVITKLAANDEFVIADFNDDSTWRWASLDIVLIKRRDTTPAEDKLERTLRAAVVKRSGWNLGTSSQRGAFVATRHEGEFSAYVGNGTDGIWCWAVLRNGVLVDHGQVPAGPTANMRATERAIAAWKSAVTR